MTDVVDVFSPLVLKSQIELKNRIVKAAMEEGLGNEHLAPDKALFNLYKTWSDGGVGTIITGNVMIDRMAMTGPGGVALEADTDLSPFRKWSQSAQHNNTKIIMQISHPGRQVFANMKGKVLAPSAIALNMGKHSKLFGQPKAMSEADIEDVIKRFTETAKQAELAGFDGVEIHAAHGYLIAQFLSPLSNQRTDRWGGDLANRSRLLLDVVAKIKQATRESFSISVKLNSADFQRGGFDIDDAEWVVNALAKLDIDFVELSGGSYESPAMQGNTRDGRTLEREAYFLEFAARIADKTSLPIMTTGGIKRFETAQRVVNSGPAMVGIASAFSFYPDLVNRWQQDNRFVAQTQVVDWRDRTLKGITNMALVGTQLRRIGLGKPVKHKVSAFWTLVLDQLRKSKLTKRYVKTRSS